MCFWKRFATILRFPYNEETTRGVERAVGVHDLVLFGAMTFIDLALLFALAVKA